MVSGQERGGRSGFSFQSYRGTGAKAAGEGKEMGLSLFVRREGEPGVLQQSPLLLRQTTERKIYESHRVSSQSTSWKEKKGGTNLSISGHSAYFYPILGGTGRRGGKEESVAHSIILHQFHPKEGKGGKKNA